MDEESKQTKAQLEFKDDGRVEDSDLQMSEDTEEYLTFVRRVLATLTAQVTLVFLFALIATAGKSATKVFGTWPAFFVSVSVLIGSMMLLVQRKDWRTDVPKKYIALTVWSLAMASLVAAFASSINALGFVTLLMGASTACGGLLLAAVYTNSRVQLEHHLKIGLLVALAMNLVVLLMMCCTMKFDMKALVVLTSLGMCAATGFYVMFDLQKVVMPELAHTGDYILGTLCIYLDISRLFYYTTTSAGSQTRS
mmetsp:Transcript_26568/g.33122  ORF Transcript_26568/g.33122 Transcript_26568/m.33122 type:complete len:252 (-) Transcript_26568:45-800(-)